MTDEATQPGSVKWCAKCGEGVTPGMCRRNDAAPGHIVVTWSQDRTRILAVTRQDSEGLVISVLARVPDEWQGPTYASPVLRPLLAESHNDTGADE